jgi:hypothetical protein
MQTVGRFALLRYFVAGHIEFYIQVQVIDLHQITETAAMRIYLVRFKVLVFEKTQMLTLCATSVKCLYVVDTSYL